jgi:hypothetical protein
MTTVTNGGSDMIAPIIDRWRGVTPADHRITCQVSDCLARADSCHEWQTPGMPAPAFWYACDRHVGDQLAEERRKGAQG